MVKKLSIAFIWHMHQPCYKDYEKNLYLMPWVRLHAVKDYLDMLLLINEFPNVKQTFNLVPLLLDQINDYANNNAHDKHSKYTISNVNDFSKEDKEFILANFFSANYEHQIAIRPKYLELYNKYYNESADIEDFSNQEISDLMALFNLAWTDSLHFENNAEMKALYKKGENYTQDDRIKIIDFHREIMKQIIPEYKKQLKAGKIEISTSPYYHSLLPLMLNPGCAKSINKNISLPELESQLKRSAQIQIENSIEKFKELFDETPKGMWLPELCINTDTLKLLLDYNFNWTIADESILAKTLKKDITRNYRGILEDPFDLCTSHTFKSSNKNINIVFRNALLSNLISFEYQNYNPKVAANDFYDRIKIAQDKLDMSPVKKHIITIGIDGENCWENYPNDGIEFLRALYTLLNNDDTLDITTVNDYVEKINSKQSLPSIQCGSWIDANFDMWIGDPTKNIAWDYLVRTKDDFVDALKHNSYTEEVRKKAENELLIAQGSDWFWWYGEPNNSGSDDVFDNLFRMHLKNVYDALQIKVPEYLNMPLEIFIGKPSKHPKSLISPKIDGKVQDYDNWTNAGCIEVPQSPTLGTKLLDKIYFGNDNQNIYIMLDFNKYLITNNTMHPNELFIYFAKRKAANYSSIRLRNKNDSVPKILKYVYTHEVQVPISKERILPVILSEAIENSMWKVNLSHNINYFHSDVLEMQIPFDDLGMKQGDGIYMVFICSNANIINQVLPLDNAIYFECP